MDEVVPINPESAPALSRVHMFGLTCSPEALSATAKSTSAPRVSVISFFGTLVSKTTATSVPGSCPSMPHFNPETSMACRSRYNIKTVSTKAQKRSGPGTNDGSTRTRSGAATSAEPNPTEPCNAEPIVITAHAASSLIGAKGSGIMVICAVFRQSPGEILGIHHLGAFSFTEALDPKGFQTFLRNVVLGDAPPLRSTGVPNLFGLFPLRCQSANGSPPNKLGVPTREVFFNRIFQNP